MTTSGNRERPLPDGWTWTLLEECSEILDRQRIPVNSRERAARIAGRLENELIPYYGATGQVGWIDKHIFNEELVLLGEDGAPFLDAGKDVAYLIRGKSWVNNHAHVLRALKSLTSNSYLLHYLNTFDFHDYVTGTTRLKLNQSRMKEIPIPIAPFPEQKQIVAEIEKQFTRLDQAVASLKRLQSNLARYKASVLKAACDGRLVPQDAKDEAAADLLSRILAERRAQWEAQEWQNLIVKAQKKAAQAARKAQGLPARIKDLQPGEWESIPEADYARFLPKHDKWKEKYKEPAGVETAVLPDLPEGWVWANLGSLFDVKVGATPSRKKLEYWGGEIPWVSSGEVAFGRIFKTRETITTEGLNNSSVKLNPKGTVLLAMIGEGKTRGQAAILEIAATNNQNAAAILCSDSPITSEWVFYWLMAKYEETRVGGAGGMQPALNSILVRAIPIAVPPRAEQERIVAEVERRLSVVATTEQAITANLARAERLRQSILGRAFTGQLVPQTEGAV